MVQEIAGDCSRHACVWNARHDEYQHGVSSLLHYATLQTQRWRPCRKVRRYKENPNGEVWFAMERAADAAGFTLFTEDKPSRGYRNLLEMYKTMHEEGWTQAQWSAQETFDGKSLKRHIQPVAALIRETGAASMQIGREHV